MGVLEGVWWPLGVVLGGLEGIWEASWALLETSGGLLGDAVGGFGGVLRAILTVFGALGSVLGTSWSFWEAPWRRLGTSWRRLGGHVEPG